MFTQNEERNWEYKFELATLETHGGGEIKSIGYINVQSKAGSSSRELALKLKLKGFPRGDKGQVRMQRTESTGDEIENAKNTRDVRVQICPTNGWWYRSSSTCLQA